MRTAAKRDLVEASIIAALLRVGCSVLPLSSPGAPDLLVGRAGKTFLLEVKTGRRKRTPLQDQFFEVWRGGTLAIVRTVDEALSAVGAIP